MPEDNSVFIGRKPAMNYVLAVVTQFNKGSDTVIVKARGKSISRAVDVVEIVRNRFINNLRIDDISIGTESLKLENKSVNVSSMEITLSKQEGTPATSAAEAFVEPPEALTEAPTEPSVEPPDAPAEAPEPPVEPPEAPAEAPEPPVEPPEALTEAPEPPIE